jgi:hypothetical protein
LNRNLDSKKKIIFILVIVNLLWIILCVRVGIIQFIEGQKWSENQRNKGILAEALWQIEEQFMMHQEE